MIRLIQRRLIIPRGDTGSFTIPYLRTKSEGDVAVFTIFDCLTHTKMYQKVIAAEGDVLNIAFTHNDTVNLKPGKYLWDIKFYANPQFLDDELVNGDEVDSYYAGYSLPQCEIRETADNYLISPDAPSATLSPTQLDIITHAIESLNDAVEKTQENVEHYPEIRDEVWYVWDAELGDFVSTGVRANGIVGNGIESAVLNDDYTLTLNFTDGTSFTSSSIRGETGNGINDIVLNNDFTLTISYTDGESYTTPSIRGPIGATPQFSIGTVQDGAQAAASITGTAENPVLNLTLPNAHVPTKVSQLENDANYAVDANYVHTDNNYTTAEKEKLNGIAAGAEVNVNADWNATSGDAQILNKPTKVSDFTNDAGYLITETDPTVPAWAKAAQKPSYTAAEVGATTEQEVSGMIAEAIGQINSFDMTVVQTLPTQDISTHTIYLVPKTGETNDVYDEYVYINNNWEMVGNTQIDLSDYALKSELPDVPVQDVQVNGASVLSNGVANVAMFDMNHAGVIAFEPDVSKTGLDFLTRNNGTKTFKLYSVTDSLIKSANASYILPVLVAKQHVSAFYGLAKAAGDTTQSASSNAVGTYTDEAKAAIQQMLDVPSTSDIPEVPVQDVQVNGTSVVQDGVANVPLANDVVGTVKVVTSGNGGIGINSTTGNLYTVKAVTSEVAAGSNNYKVIVPANIHESAFYGLAKAAGASMASSPNPVGTYTDSAKSAIRSMIGAASPNVIAVQDTQPTDVDTKIWLPETAGTPIEVPTVAEMNAALAQKVDDVQVNGVSVVTNGVANIPVASSGTLGVIRVQPGYGIKIQSDNNSLRINEAPDGIIKQGTDPDYPIVSKNSSTATFYGLAKAAGHDEASSTEPLGTYTPEAKGAIQQMLGVSDLIATAENTLVASKAYAIGDIFTANGKLYKVTTAIAANDSIVLQNSGETVSGANAEEIKLSDYAVHDVQVNGTSVMQDGVANVPIAGNGTTATFGVVRGYASSGIEVDATYGTLKIRPASTNDMKGGTGPYYPVTSATQHIATFYGLAKAAGDSTQSASSNAVGTYTDNAKASIKAMLGIQDGSTGTVDVTGTTPTITAVENTRYVCGEVTSLDFTPAASGICIVRFTSGSTVTVLTLPSTVKFPAWFDSTSLETNTIYEICVTDGIYGAVMSWAL